MRTHLLRWVIRFELAIDDERGDHVDAGVRSVRPPAQRADELSARV
jgi:hypothetical protein